MHPALKSLLISTMLTISFGFASAGVDCKSGKDDSNVAYTITVDQSSNQYKTVQSAINSIPAENNQWITVHIKRGTYTIEKVEIPYDKPCIFLERDGRSVIKIAFNDHQKTDITAIFSSFPDNVVAKSITFENSHNLALELQEELAKGNTDLGTLQAGEDITQALGARIYGDKSAIYECGFLGVQDTLLDVSGRHFFKNRQSTNDQVGFVFRRGVVLGSGETYLGRAYGQYSRLIFYAIQLSSVASPTEWNAWNFQEKEGNFAHAEINCKGPWKEF